jgi:hypothetical protein
VVSGHNIGSAIVGVDKAVLVGVPVAEEWDERAAVEVSRRGAAGKVEIGIELGGGQEDERRPVILLSAVPLPRRVSLPDSDDSELTVKVNTGTSSARSSVSFIFILSPLLIASTVPILEPA